MHGMHALERLEVRHLVNRIILEDLGPVFIRQMSDHFHENIRQRQEGPASVLDAQHPLAPRTPQDSLDAYMESTREMSGNHYLKRRIRKYKVR